MRHTGFLVVFPPHLANLFSYNKTQQHESSLTKRIKGKKEAGKMSNEFEQTTLVSSAGEVTVLTLTLYNSWLAESDQIEASENKPLNLAFK